MPVYASQSVNCEAYSEGSMCDGVLCDCVKRSIDLLRYMKVHRCFIASVASQSLSTSLHRRLSFVSPARALAGEKVVELSSPSPVNGRRGTPMCIHGDVDVIHGEPPGAP